MHRSILDRKPGRDCHENVMSKDGAKKRPAGGFLRGRGLGDGGNDFDIHSTPLNIYLEMVNFL